MKFKIDKTKISSPKIIVIWLIALFCFTIITSIILGLTTPGGEQAPEEFVAKMINVAVYSTLIISLITFIITPRNRYLNLAIIIFIIILLCMVYGVLLNKGMPYK
jgi:hypothetical protein